MKSNYINSCINASSLSTFTKFRWSYHILKKEQELKWHNKSLVKIHHEMKNNQVNRRKEK